MTENVGKHVQEDLTAAKQSPDGATGFTDKQSFVSFFQHGSNSILLVSGLLIICIFGIGYYLFKSNQYNQVPIGPSKLTVTTAEPQPTTIQNTSAPMIATASPTIAPTVSIEPTTKPLATKKLATPTPKVVKGVDLRFVDVHFNPTPEPNKAYKPYRVVNGGSVTVPNEKHEGEFTLTTVLVNNGTDDSGTVWVHYYIDDTEVKKGVAFLPGNMVIDDLVTRDSASPIKIPASGTHTIKIVIDPDNQSNDVNTANNTYSFTYSVQ